MKMNLINGIPAFLVKDYQRKAAAVQQKQPAFSVNLSWDSNGIKVSATVSNAENAGSHRSNDFYYRLIRAKVAFDGMRRLFALL